MTVIIINSDRQLERCRRWDTRFPATTRMAGVVLILLSGMFSGCDNPVEGDNVFSCVEDSVTTCWTVENSPYVIMDTLIVEAGKMLLIEQGVTIAFDSRAALIIGGTLRAQGSEDSNIVFTSLSGIGDYGHNMYWNGIGFEPTSTNSVLVHCLIEYCFEQHVRVTGSSPIISKCILRYNLPHADTGGNSIFCEEYSRPIIKYNILTSFSNFNATAIICRSSSNPRIEHNDIYCSFNAYDRAVYGGGFLDGNYLVARVWDSTEYVLIPDLSLGTPIDTRGDGICTTTSTNSLGLFKDVDGVINPRSTPNRAVPE